MLSRRQFIARGLSASPLVALATSAPAFVTRTALAAEPKADKDTVLVVLELTGGNDGLNTVVRYADDLYQKARPTLRLTKQQLLRVDDHVGLHPSLRGLERLLKDGQVTGRQCVGYSNPDRSHCESMDIWQSADPKRQTTAGWRGRGLNGIKVGSGAIPGLYVGTEKLPLAVAGSPVAVPSIHHTRTFDLELGTNFLPPNSPTGRPPV